jgi:hypothetical protein
MLKGCFEWSWAPIGSVAMEARARLSLPTETNSVCDGAMTAGAAGTGRRTAKFRTMTQSECQDQAALRK